MLFDAHSIRSVIPHLFDGKLPDFNLGTFNGAACDPGLASQLEAICAAHPQYTHVLNGRFKGGHITRHYGNPAQNIHAVQLELCQSTYMEELEPFRYRADLAGPTRVVLKAVVGGVLGWGKRRYRLKSPSRASPLPHLTEFQRECGRVWERACSRRRPLQFASVQLPVAQFVFDPGLTG